MSWRRPPSVRVALDQVHDVVLGEDVKVHLPVDPGNRTVVTFILQTTAIEFNIPLHSILGNRRNKTSVQARHTAIFLVYSWTKMSLSDIGTIFNRDHSTVNHVMEKMSSLMLGTTLAKGDYLQPMIGVEAKLIEKYSERKPKD